MDKISALVHRLELLQKLSNVRLYLKVSRLSNIATEDGQWIHEWPFNGHPEISNLQWPKRRHPLEHNWKMRRDTIKSIFYGAQGLFPTRLGARLCISPRQWKVNPEPLFWDILHQYPMRYRAILGPTIVAKHMTSQIRHKYNHQRLHTTDSELIVRTTIVRRTGSHAKRARRITKHYVEWYK